MAENAGGMRAVKYGVTSNYVMGLEVVLSDGTVLQTGGKAIKNVTGYNLTSLFTGSEGTLGIITKVLLRVIPMPKKRGTLQLMFRTLDDGCTTIHRMLQSGLVPAAAEIMDRFCLEAVAKHRKTELDPAIGACIVIEIDGDDDEALAGADEADGSRGPAVRGLPVPRCPVAAGVRRSVGHPAGHQFRHRQPRAEPARRGHLGPARRLPRGGAPHRGHRREARAHHRRLRPRRRRQHPPLRPLRPEQARGGGAGPSGPSTRSFDATLAVGGTLSGEHGIGITKRPYIAKALGEAGVKALSAVKQALDPKGILNPGKIW